MGNEIVERYTSLADQFGARVEAVPEGAWSNPAPCEGWTARDVVEHIVGGQGSLITAITGAAPAVAEGADPKEAWRASYAATKVALEQPGALDKVVPGPAGEMDLTTLVGRFMSNDVLVHTWDLARATGGDERIDPIAVTQAHSGMKPMDEMIRRPGVFGPKVEPAADADEQEQFLNFLGRTTR
jgi:uncharacterized protein (TIGR03086 family)